jgi:hypothetical protein
VEPDRTLPLFWSAVNPLLQYYFFDQLLTNCDYQTPDDFSLFGVFPGWGPMTKRRLPVFGCLLIESLYAKKFATASTP